jgi:acyl-CoA synthetase (NDP forming)
LAERGACGMLSAMLSRLFAPSAIAVIGASPDAGRIRGRLLQLLRQGGFAGRIYPVNPSYAEIDGLRCYRDVSAIGAPVDLAIVVIPAPHVPDSLLACARAGIPYAVVISSGFAEEGGKAAALQTRLKQIAQETGMRILGPNSEGFYNAAAGVAATFSPAVDAHAGDAPVIAGAGRIGVVAQSGGIGFSFLHRGRVLGLQFSSLITTGNEADLTAADCFLHLAEDQETAALLLFLETVRDAARFAEAARLAAARGKSVVVVKVGDSEGGSRASASHTAAMTGWECAYRAAFRSLGMIPAHDPDEALAILAALTTSPPARGRRAGIITTSGGAGAWLADALAAAGFALPELSPGLQAEIRSYIPSYGSPRNPVDITAQAVHSGGMNRTIGLLSASTEVDLIAVAFSAANDTRLSVQPEELAPLLARREKPVLFFSYTLPSPFARRGLAEAGAAIHTGLHAVSAAAKALCGTARARQPSAWAVARPPEGLLQKLRAHPGPWMECSAKEVLAEWGIPIAPRILVRTKEELAEAARRLGVPLAAKVQSPAILHKTEAGGVRLNIRSAAELEEAFAALMEKGRTIAGEALAGVLLEPMAPPGVEMIVGAVRDATFGPLVMVGAGGIAAELWQDTAYRLAPVDESEAMEMIAELSSARLLAGYRGAPRADVPALARLTAALSAFAVACRNEVAELELNPVIVHAEGHGLSVADALIVVDAKV